jgi:2-iminobutanoate/2-iminopropanoate deaminase
MYWILEETSAIYFRRSEFNPADIVKVTPLLADIKDFKAVDQIYSAWLPGLGVTPLPARTAFAAASLPAGALVMLDVVAAYPSD